MSGSQGDAGQCFQAALTDACLSNSIGQFNLNSCNTNYRKKRILLVLCDEVMSFLCGAERH